MDVPGIGRRFKKGIRGAGLGSRLRSMQSGWAFSRLGDISKEVGLRLASAGAIRKPTPLG